LSQTLTRCNSINFRRVVMASFLDNFQTRLTTNAASTVGTVPGNLSNGFNTFIGVTNAFVGLSPIGKGIQFARLAEASAVSFAAGGTSASWGGVINAATGLAVGAAFIAFAPATVPAALIGTVAAIVAGVVAQSAAEAIVDTYPNLGSDFASFSADLTASIVSAMSAVWDSGSNLGGMLSDLLSDMPNNFPFGMSFPNPGSLPVDPLVIDLNGDGVKLTGVANSTAFFDYAADGFREKTGWAAGGDGILVRDLDSNGLIESLPELLATQTQNVFQVLKTFDTNNDNKIDANDSIWATLKVWVDADGDGITDAGELKTLSSLGLTDISLNTTTVSQWDNGNRIDAASTVTINGVQQQAQAVFFGTQANDAVFVVPANFVAHSDTWYLPNLSGGGGVPPLYYSMTNNAALRAEVKTLVQNAGSMSYAQLRAAVETMILNWSGADDAVLGSRGAYIDARHAAAVEAFGGSTTVTSIHAPPAALLESLYQKLVDDFTIRFAAQSYVSAIGLAVQQSPPTFLQNHNYSFLSTLGFDATTNGLSLNAGEFALSIVEAIQAAGSDALTVLKSGVYTNAMVQSFAAVNSLVEKTAIEFVQSTDWSRQDISSSLSEDDLAAVKIIHFLMAGGTVADVRAGSATADTIVFDATDLFGLGAAGNDSILGNSLANTIFGGQGDDSLNGDNGNDTYIYNNGDGADSITELANKGREDELQIAGHTLTELKVARSATNGNDLVLTFTNNTDKITLVGAAASAVVGTGVENFVLSGGVTKTLAEIYQIAVNQQQTTGADVVRGFNSATDVITGGLGADALNGEDGNDTYIYNNGDGADTITELANKGTADKLQIAGHTLTELKVARSSTNANDLVLTFTNNTDKITLVGAAASAVVGTGVENFVLSGGVTKTLAEIYQIAVNQQQTSGADIVRGFNSAADVITGGLGADALNGEDGNDTYIYNNGDGADTITELANKGTADKLQIAGHTLTELKVARSATNANDLVLTFTNNADKITLLGAGASTVVGTGVESFVLSGGVTKTIAELYQIAINQQQTAGADTISGFASTNDVITGGLGNDTMSGKGSNDTFVFASGFGKDVISDFSAGTGLGDVMRFSLGTSFDSYAEVLAAAVQVGANTVINITANDTITLTGITKTLLVADDFAFL
jgi:Ca2+-binding RTX toxin-like protein